MRFCVNCKYVVVDTSHTCTKFTSTDLVTGQTNQLYCMYLRDTNGKCGPVGRGFEPKDKLINDEA